MSDEKTPSAVLVTPAEKVVVRGALRTFIKEIVPHLPEIAKYAGPALVGFILTTAHTWANKAETEHKVKVGYETLAPAAREQGEEIVELKRAVAQLADSVALQAHLALASRPGFDNKGKPEPPAVIAANKKRAKPHPAAPPADPVIVKQVQVDAAKNQALKARLVVERPASLPVPPTLPAEVPKPQVVAPPASPPQEWPPPVPQTWDAGHSP